MELKRFNAIVDDLKEVLGSALIATDSWITSDGQASYNSQPKATALFNEITVSLRKSLKNADFPGLGKFYLINLDNNFIVMVVIQGELQEGMLVDMSKTTLGILINIALPKVQEGLAEAAK